MKVQIICLVVFLILRIDNVLAQELTLKEQGQTHLLLEEVEPNVEVIGVLPIQPTTAKMPKYEVVHPSTIIIEDLEPAHIYDVIYYNGKDTLTNRYITESNSSGEIEIYFNYEISPGSPGSLEPDGTSYGDVENAIRKLINGAETSIDYCAYNTNVTSIVNALIDAKNRGVRVRVIMESENSNSAFDGNFDFPILEDRNPNLMHNKFIIVDAESESNAKVVTGSMNFTQGQMASDPNHLMIIHDQSLARTFELEFNEMWGSSGENYNLNISKFGNQKTDNTPHQFTIGGIPCSLYFSPSDQTSENIGKALKTANQTIDIGLLIFTYWDLRDNLIDRIIQDGIRVRGIVEDDHNSEDVVNELRENGAQIFYHSAFPIYHHKMAIVDGDESGSDPKLVSGSHNWTYTAETANDENTMIFSDYGIAELFSRAFAEQWKKFPTALGPDLSLPGHIIKSSISHSHLELVDHINYDGLRCEVYSTNGSLLMNTFIHQNRIDVSGLSPGVYIITLYSNETIHNAKFIKI